MYSVSQRHSKASYRKPLSEIPRVFPKATFTLFHCIRALGNKIFWPHYSQLSYPRLGCWAVLHWGRGEEGDAGRKHSSLPRHSAKPISGGEVTVTQLSPDNWHLCPRNCRTASSFHLTEAFIWKRESPFHLLFPWVNAFAMNFVDFVIVIDYLQDCPAFLVSPEKYQQV